LGTALQVVSEWLSRPGFRQLAAGKRHFERIRGLCLRYGAAGNAVYVLHLAALAIEHRAELWPLDTGFARIREVDCRNPTGHGAR
jgi:uncharacterized protein